MCALVLEELLREMCREGGERVAPFDQQLERIRAAQQQNWTTVTLKWFTDHTPEGHSRRIIELLGRAFDGQELLDRNELFVLLAACYLHDLGMQDAKIDGRWIERMTSEDWDLVRERHPESSCELIINRTLDRGRDEFEIGLPSSSDFIEAIAYIAKSHGSKYFEETLDYLRDRDFTPEGKTMRLRAVAALLLMGDELDLQRQRVQPWPQDHFKLSPTGQLHFHLHSYIEQVKFERGSPTAERQIVLRMAFPSDSDGYRSQLKEWLLRKLLKQIRRTNPIVKEELDGAFYWGETIAIDDVVAGPVGRPLPPAARRRLALEVSRDRIVDRIGLRSEIQKAVEERASQSTVIGLRHGAKSDASVLLGWMDALVRSSGAVPLLLDLTLREGYDVLDLPEIFGRLVDAEQDYLEALASEADVPPRELTGLAAAQSPSRLREALVHALATGDAVFIVRNQSRATAMTKAWCDQVVRDIAGGHSGVVVVIDTSAMSLPDGSKTHRLKPFNERHIAKHLSDRLGYPAEQAVHEAERIMGLSAGAAGPVVHDMLERVNRSAEPRL